MCVTMLGLVGRVLLLDVLNLLRHVVSHQLVKLVGHTWVSFIGRDSIDGSLEVTRLVDMSETLFAGEGQTSF
jgi:hypothetical protein